MNQDGERQWKISERWDVTSRTVRRWRQSRPLRTVHIGGGALRVLGPHGVAAAPDTVRRENTRPGLAQKMMALVQLLARQAARDHLASSHQDKAVHDAAIGMALIPTKASS